MNIIDFDKLYNDYVKDWTKSNAAKLKKSEPLDFVNQIYEQWTVTPLKEIGGISAKEYFKNKSGEESINLLQEYNNQNISIPAPLIDKLSDIKFEDNLVKLLKEKQKEEELFILATNILEEISSKKHLDILIDVMLNEGLNSETRDFAAEVLAAHATEVKEKIKAQVKNDTSKNDMYIADILVYCKGDEFVFNLLKALFLSNVNNTLYAAYLGMYEDERALPLLQKRIKSEEIGYVEFTELRNSIERLGGEVNVEKDFSFDSDYKVLNNLK